MVRCFHLSLEYLKDLIYHSTQLLKGEMDYLRDKSLGNLKLLALSHLMEILKENHLS